ncbi:DUF547 domain-containing protein [Zobellia nedashkovskayae]
MSAIRFKYPVIIFILVLSIFPSYGQISKSKILDLNTFSETFLTQVRNNQDTNELRAQLYNTTLEELVDGLNTDEKKLAFWLNVYNAYIQVVLSENPEKYDDRGTFFSSEQIPIAGRLVSFEKIEHGIIRKSQWKLGLGMVRKWFPNKFERKLRVNHRDYRVHFALNCGAKDCPPVAIYDADKLNEQLNKGTAAYLTKTSTYNKETGEVSVTSLFSWFRGDFGCKSGVKDILKEFGITTTTKDIDLNYKSYDWTLDLDNWIDL